jgi:hypothetical protein
MLVTVERWPCRQTLKPGMAIALGLGSAAPVSRSTVPTAVAATVDDEDIF